MAEEVKPQSRLETLLKSGFLNVVFLLVGMGVGAYFISLSSPGIGVHGNQVDKTAYIDLTFSFEYSLIANMFFGAILFIWTKNKIRDPKFWFWITRTPFVVTLVRTRANSIVEYLHKKADIGPGNQVIIDEDAFTLADVDDSGRSTRFSRYNQPAYILDALNTRGDNLPEAFVNGTQLDAYWNPDRMGRIANGEIERHLSSRRKDRMNVVIALCALMLIMITVVGIIMLQQYGLLQQLIPSATPPATVRNPGVPG